MFHMHLKNTIDKISHLIPDNEKSIIYSCLSQIEEENKIEEKVFREVRTERNKLLEKTKNITWEDFMSGENPLNNISSFLSSIKKLEKFFVDEIEKIEKYEFSYEGFADNGDTITIFYVAILNDTELESKEITITHDEVLKAMQ